MKKIIAFVSLIVISFVSLVVFQVIKFLSVSKGEKISMYQNPQKALLVIDIQKAFTDPGARIVDGTQAVSMIAGANLLTELFVGMNKPVIYIKTEYDGSDHIMNFIRKNKALKGAAETEFDDRLRLSGTAVFSKSCMDSFSNQAFEEYLIKNRVDHLVITGLEARYCIFGAVSGALGRGYRVTVISDAIASVDDASRDRMLEKFRQLGATIKTSAQVLKEIDFK